MNRLTRQETSAPPSIALASMAMCLAESRTTIEGFWTRHKILPCERVHVNPAIHQVSAEYYAIIDRIARGEWP